MEHVYLLASSYTNDAQDIDTCDQWEAVFTTPEKAMAGSISKFGERQWKRVDGAVRPAWHTGVFEWDGGHCSLFIHQTKVDPS